MSITIYSMILAVVWFDIFVLLGCFLQRRIGLFLNYNFYPVVLLIILSLIRLFAPLETPFTTIIRSETFAPVIQSALNHKVTLSELLSVSFSWLVVLISSVISVILLIKMLLKYRRSLIEINSYPETDDKRLLRLLNIVADKKNSCRLCVMDEDIGPAICGLGKPTIILPAAVQSMTDEDIYFILLHECWHQKEKDLWAKCFIEIICCFMFWNPVVYLLKRDIDQTFELKCDLKTTLQLGEGERLDYLSTLLKVARIQQSSVKAHPVAIQFTGKLGKDDVNTKQRFQAVLARDRHNSKIELLSVVCMLTIFIASFAFVVQPYYAPPMDDLTGITYPSRVETSNLTLTPENAFILQKRSGDYLLFVDGKPVRGLSIDELNNKAHASLPIVKEKNE